MTIKKITMLVTNVDLGKLPDHTEYARVGLLSLEDGQKFDVSCREPEIYNKLKPLNTATMNLDLSNSKYGMKLSILEVISTDKGLAS